MANVYRVPFVPFKLAAVSVITNPANGLYGTGDLVGTLVVPKSQKLRSIHDARPKTTPAAPYFVWGAKTGSPDGSRSTTFHAMGSELTITGHVFSAQQYSTDEADEICNRFVELFHHQDLTLSGFTTLLVECSIIDIVPDPVGQHGILQFRPLVQVTPV